MTGERRDLYQRLQWLYGDALARMTSPQTVMDLTAWKRLISLPESAHKDR